MLFAIVLTNYWIADEIYPDFSGASKLCRGDDQYGGQGSNMNFPAPLAVVGFLAACGGLFVACRSRAFSGLRASQSLHAWPGPQLALEG